MRRITAFLLIFNLIFLCACASAPPSSSGDETAVISPLPSPGPQEDAPVTTEEPPAGDEAAEPSPSPFQSEEEATPEARELKLYLSGGVQGRSQLIDGNTTTLGLLSWRADALFTADEEIGGVYVRWFDEPSPWEIVAGDTVIHAGQSGYLHEYVALPPGCSSFTVRMPEGTELRAEELWAFSPGRTPDWVQLWQEPCERAELLLFPTHADDEFVFFGGVIPKYVERGLDIQVVYMISHYHSDRARCGELLDGLWHAGIRHYPVINDAPDRECRGLDEAIWIYKEEPFLSFQVEQIRRFRPLVIVSHAENGEYKQGAHMLCTHCLEQAVELASDGSYQPESAEKYGLWDTPKTYLHLYGPEEERTVLDYETPLEAFGGRSAYEVASEAFALHRTQQQWHFRVYGFDSPYDSHSFGLYRSTVGPDEAREDLFEHVAPELYS